MYVRTYSWCIYVHTLTAIFDVRTFLFGFGRTVTSPVLLLWIRFPNFLSFFCSVFLCHLVPFLYLTFCFPLCVSVLLKKHKNKTKRESFRWPPFSFFFVLDASRTRGMRKKGRRKKRPIVAYVVGEAWQDHLFSLAFPWTQSSALDSLVYVCVFWFFLLSFVVLVDAPFILLLGAFLCSPWWKWPQKGRNALFCYFLALLFWQHIWPCSFTLFISSFFYAFLLFHWRFFFFVLWWFFIFEIGSE